MYILLDSCIWRNEEGLSSAVGKLARALIRDSGAVLAIPEIVQLEAKRVLVERLNTQREKALTSGRHLTAAMGKGGSPPALPSRDEIVTRVSEMIDHVDVETKVIPITLEAARNATIRAVEGGPPKRVRDGMTWQTCLNLLDDRDVHFVTGDKAFFEDEKRTRLASALDEDAERRKHEVAIHSSLGELLTALKATRKYLVLTRLDEECLLEEVLDEIHDWVSDLVEEDGLSLGQYYSDAEIDSAYLTSDQQEVLVEVNIEWPCSRRSYVTHGTHEGFVTANVFGLLDRLADRIREVELCHVEINCEDQWSSYVLGRESEGVKRLVRLDDEGRQMRLQPKLQEE